MKRYLYLLLLLIVGCGECPPCEYGIEEKHRNVLECAGFVEYVESHVDCAVFRDDLHHNGRQVVGMADCDCGMIYVKILPDLFGRECETIVHEAAHLEEGCNDQTYSEQMEKDFLSAMHEFDCWDLANSYNE